MTARFLVTTVFLALVYAHPTAVADKQAEAAAFKTLAKSAFQEGRFRECAEYFAKSNALVSEPNNLFNQGLCLENASDYAQALVALKEYLRLEPKGSKAGEAQTRIELLEYKIASQKGPTPVREQEPAPVEPEPAPTEQVPAPDPETTRTAAEKDAEARRLFGRFAPTTTATPNVEAPMAAAPTSVFNAPPRARPRVNAPYFNLDLSLSYLSDDEETGATPRFAFRGIFPTDSSATPNLFGLGADMIYSPLWGTSVGMSFRYAVTLGNFRPYGEVAVGLQTRFHDESSDNPLGFDFPLRAGLQIPLSQWFIGAEYSNRPFDGVDGFGVQLGFKLAAPN